MLVRRFSDAAITELHRLRPHILMDAGELGSRNVSVCWLEVPAGASEELRSHVYVVVSGSGTMSATGDTQQLAVGDLVLIPPATDHAVANDGADTLALVSVQSPPVSADELFSRRLAAQATGYDDYEDD
jgi:mannose-6-phosphate isomerase-like protein (cupin superfamily)